MDNKKQMKKNKYKSRFKQKVCLSCSNLFVNNRYNVKRCKDCLKDIKMIDYYRNKISERRKKKRLNFNPEITEQLREISERRVSNV